MSRSHFHSDASSLKMLGENTVGVMHEIKGHPGILDSQAPFELPQLPLPSHIVESEVLDEIALDKDVDGFHPSNLGLLAKRNRAPHAVPCTPAGVMQMLERSKVRPRTLMYMLACTHARPAWLWISCPVQACVCVQEGMHAGNRDAFRLAQTPAASSSCCPGPKTLNTKNGNLIGRFRRLPCLLRETEFGGSARVNPGPGTRNPGTRSLKP